MPCTILRSQAVERAIVPIAATPKPAPICCPSLVLGYRVADGTTDRIRIIAPYPQAVKLAASVERHSRSNQEEYNDRLLWKRWGQPDPAGHPEHNPHSFTAPPIPVTLARP